MVHLTHKKKIIIGISAVIFLLCIVAVGLLFMYQQGTITIFANHTKALVPNVTTENTVFHLSDTEKQAEKVTILVEDKLEPYDLYYYVQTESDTALTMDAQNYALWKDQIVLDENATVYFKYGANGHYSEENYEIKVTNIEISEIASSEKATEKELKEEKVKKKDIKKSSSPYYIKVNYKANTITVYKKDKNNQYTIPVKAIICSTGVATPTSGIYKTSNKYRWGKLIHNSYGQYSTRIVGSILFHSVPYYAPRNDALYYKQYDRLGTKASAGCIRLTTIDAKWIYENCPSGTMVEFYASSNPGPLGKPTAQKISSVKECRNWDPTDPKAGNPWRTYQPKKEEQKNTTINSSNQLPTNSSVSSNLLENTLSNTTDYHNTAENNHNTVDNHITSENTQNTSNTISNAVIDQVLL